jgi:hypothetical protein
MILQYAALIILENIGSWVIPILETWWHNCKKSYLLISPPISSHMSWNIRKYREDY